MPISSNTKSFINDFNTNIVLKVISKENQEYSLPDYIKDNLIVLRLIESNTETNKLFVLYNIKLVKSNLENFKEFLAQLIKDGNEIAHLRFLNSEREYLIPEWYKQDILNIKKHNLLWIKKSPN